MIRPSCSETVDVMASFSTNECQHLDVLQCVQPTWEAARLDGADGASVPPCAGSTVSHVGLQHGRGVAARRNMSASMQNVVRV